MKKIITLLIILLTFSTLAPSISLANNKISNETNLTIVNELEMDFKMILDTDEMVIFQTKESDGKTYEYIEKVTTLENGTELLTQEKYLVLHNTSKQLIDTKEVLIDEVLKDINLKDEVLIDEVSKDINLKDINKSNLNSTVILSSSSSGSGGSSIADVRWKEYSNGYAHAIAGGAKTKYIKKTQWQYRDFKAAANELQGMERALLSGGVLGVTDALVAAFRKGEMLSWTLVKKVINQVGKGIPIVGTAYSVYQYGQKYFEAQDLYKKIPS